MSGVVSPSCLQRIAPDLVAPLWRVRELRDLPLDVREQIADVLGCEAATRGLDEDEEPNAYGRELGELFDALGAVGEPAASTASGPMTVKKLVEMAA
jgi:hypothetical protein